VHGERSLYSSRWVDVKLVDVELPDGERFEHHALRMQHVAVVVVVDEQDRVLMLRRHRFIDDSWGWEVPVGIVEQGEDPRDTAMREAEEETGWRPRDLSLILTFQPAIGIADSEHHVFLGHGAERVGPPTDINEADTVAWVRLLDVLGMVSKGEIRDGASLVGLLHLLASRDGA
jgi:8-oxo-dGTP pyrophosphatase MutT (NUDIX family)